MRCPMFTRASIRERIRTSSDLAAAACPTICSVGQRHGGPDGLQRTMGWPPCDARSGARTAAVIVTSIKVYLGIA
jgi:hypothetical protein